MSKLLVVFGATGNQGKSVVEYVLKDPEFSKEYTIRAVTRDPSSASSKSLNDLGTEVVQGDLEDRASVKAALEGAFAVFLATTSVYDGKLEEREFAVGKSTADLAVAAGAQMLIYSSLTHAGSVSKGKYKNMGHFDSKAEVEQYIRTLPIKSAFFAPGSFMQNFETHMSPQPLGDGSYALFNFISPDAQLPLIDILGDAGKWVGAVLAEPDKYNGKFFAASTRLYAYAEVAEIIGKKKGKKVVYQQVPLDTFKSFLLPTMSPYIVDMFSWIQDEGYYGPGSKEQVEWAAAQTRGKLTTLEEWLDKATINFA